MKIDNQDQVVILAGGYAKRLGSLTKNKPKSLIKFSGKPFIYHQLKYFENRGIKNVLILLGHHSNLIKTEIKKYKFTNLKIKFNHDGAKNIGTGGALKKAREKLFDNFFLIYGDTFPQVDIRKLKNKHFMSKSFYTMVIYKNNNRLDKSNILLVNNKIIDYGKSLKKAQFIDYGISMINKKIINKTPSKIFDLKRIIDFIIKKETFNYLIEKKRFYEIGSINGINQFKLFLKTS